MPSKGGGGDSKTPKTKKTKTAKAGKKKSVTKKSPGSKAKSTKKKTARRKATAKKSRRKVSGSVNKLRVRQVRSGIGSPEVFRRTLTALGLKHHQDEVVVPDNPSIRGMLRTVHHLVSVRLEGENV
jgi:large subunit ribosomal protein L30